MAEVVRMPGISLFRSLTSSMIDRLRLGHGHGVTFKGARDIYEACGYDKRLVLKQYRQRYQRGDIACRVIEAYPEATWRGTGHDCVFDSEDVETETPFERAWNDLNKRLRIWSKFYRADVLAGLGHYSILLIGATGDYHTPLETASADDLLFLQPFCQEDAVITQWQEDTKDPRYGLPLQYQLRRVSVLDRHNERGNAPMAEKFSRPVHFSRVIHIADGKLDDDVYGKPRLEHIWNRLDDLDKLLGAGAEAFWQRAHQGFQFDIDPEIEFEPEEREKFKTEIDDFMNRLSRVVRTRGVKMQAFGSDVARFDDNASSLISFISAATKIPKRLLMGSEQGELASSQDRDNWRERVQDRRTRFAEPDVVRPFVDRLVELGALPKPQVQPVIESPIGAAVRPVPGEELPTTEVEDAIEERAARRAAVRAKHRVTVAVGLPSDEDPAQIARTDNPVGVPEVAGVVVGEDEAEDSADYQVYWDEVLDVPQLDRFNTAKIAKELGGSVITDAEIRTDLLGRDPMSEEDLAAFEAKQQEDKQFEMEKMKARGPSPIGGGGADEDVPASPGRPPFGPGPRAAEDADLGTDLRSATVRKRGGKYCLIARDGKVLGCHATAKEAYAQEAAIKHSHARRAQEPKVSIYLQVDEDAAKRIALRGPGAEPPSSLHVALAQYQGDFDAAVEALRSAVEQWPTLYGKTAGIGTSGGVLWIRPEVGGLDDLRERVLSALGVRSTREYQPRIALAHVEPGSEISLPVIEPEPLYFSRLYVKKGDQEAEFWLSYPPVSEV